jgi:hypothetical protein
MSPGDTKAIIAIRWERLRQRADEDFSDYRDDQYVHGELASAAACYAAPPRFREAFTRLLAVWPWSPSKWKPTPHDRVRELVKAGALIVAEIERLQRAESARAEGNCHAKSDTAPVGEDGRRERTF